MRGQFILCLLILTTATGIACFGSQSNAARIPSTETIVAQTPDIEELGTSFHPTTITFEVSNPVEPGSRVTARVNITEVTDFDAAQFNVSFDPAVLTLDDVTTGVGIADGQINGTLMAHLFRW